MNAGQRSLIEIYMRQLAGSARVLVNGEPILLDSQDMKHYLAAAWRKEAKRLALSPEGDAVILLGASTRPMSVTEASDFISYIEWYATLKGIRLIEQEPKP